MLPLIPLSAVSSENGTLLSGCLSWDWVAVPMGGEEGGDSSAQEVHGHTRTSRPSL